MKAEKFNYAASEHRLYVCPCCTAIWTDQKLHYCPNCEVKLEYASQSEPKDSAEERYEKANKFLSHEVYMNGEFNRIDMALRIAAGLPPTVETKKD